MRQDLEHKYDELMNPVGMGSIVHPVSSIVTKGKTV